MIDSSDTIFDRGSLTKRGHFMRGDINNAALFSGKLYRFKGYHCWFAVKPMTLCLALGKGGHFGFGFATRPRGNFPNRLEVIECRAF